MNRSIFLQEYHLEVEKAFVVDGRQAEWAPGTTGPRFWGEEDACLELVQDDPNRSNTPTAAIAASPDGGLLAVATNSVIRIYDMETKQYRAELVGHSGNVGTLYFVTAPIAAASEKVQISQTKYLLISQSSRVGGSPGHIIFWDLDNNGRCLNSRTMPFAIEAMIDKAMKAISEDLETHHEMLAQDIDAIRTGFADVLTKADAHNRVQDLPRLDGHFPRLGSTVVSHDGQRLIYTAHGSTTQSGMRPPDELPQIVVVDLASRSEIFRLKGHEDAIMWASWSPDDKTIATASWDSTYTLWDAQTGAKKHVIGPTDGQNWSGTLSPDSKHVLLSGGNPTGVVVYDVQTAAEVTRLDYDGRRGWCRNISWSPKGDAIALSFDHTQSVLLWHPYTKAQESIEIVKLKNDGSHLDGFCSFALIKWVDDGKKLVAETTEGSILVWEPERHVQWRFQRPVSTVFKTFSSDVLFRSETQTLLTLDGDDKVREWKL